MRKNLLTVLILLVIIGIIAGTGFLAWRVIQGRNTQPPQKLPNKEDQKKERVAKQEVLLESIKEIVATESPGTSISLAIYDLNNDEYFGVNDTEPQHAASVSKVLTAVYVLDQVEKGKASLADPLGAYNIEFQLEKTVNQSDPETWALLDERFKPADQNKFAQAIGLEKTDIRIGKNLMAPKDIAILLKKLAKGELLKDYHRDKLFTYMQNTESENYFSPIFKSSGLPFYHKTAKFESAPPDA